MKRPNVLLLHGDQHRWDCLGCCGNPDVKTPHIDSLASDGVRHTQHYTVYPVCTPSRYSLLSGQYVHQHSAWSNHSTLPAGTATFPKLLRDCGYRTAAVGKMHFSPTYLDVGFDRMTLAEQNGDGRFEDDYHAYLMKRGLVDSVDLTDQVDDFRGRASEDYHRRFGAFESDLPAEHHSTAWITRQALAEIEDWNEEGGNLLMVGYVKPHHPFDPPAPYSTMYDPASLTLPDGWTSEEPAVDFQNQAGFFDYRTLTEESLRRVLAYYYGTITQIDDGVGEILALLRRKGIYDDTLIIYTSDHGEYLGHHHMLLKGNFLYDPLAHIPLIVKYPGSDMAGRVDDRLSENIDLCPTILSVCGVEPAPAMGGADLRTQDREFVFSEGQYGTDREPQIGYMIRSRQGKLLVQGSAERVRYFDLRSDPQELHDEAENPAYGDRIRRHWMALIDRVMFSGSGKNHLDAAAPQRRVQAELDARAKQVRAFAEEQIRIL